ncbi:MAG: penicillin-binding protein 2 [Thermoanaerobaculia bacterium]
MKRVREHRDALLRRLPALQIAVAAAMVVVVGSYWFVQVVQGDYYRELAENNRLRELPVEAARGLIFDRESRLLVENVPSYNLLLEVSRSRDVAMSLEFAAGILGRPESELEDVLERHRAAVPFRPILVAEDLTLSDVAKFSASALEHPEFEIDVTHLRLYRFGRIAAHALGHLGQVSEADLKRSESPYRVGDLVGKSGVEHSYDIDLKGRDGERVVIVDSRGRLLEEHDQEPAVVGNDLSLALSVELQQEAARFFEGKTGAVVALDPRTGEVVALLSSPSFDPNLFSRRLDRDAWRQLVDDPRHPLQNRSIQNAYPPGSVFKIVMAVAGLSEKVVAPHHRVFCPGSTEIYNRRFRCWKRGGHGWMDLRSALIESCDVYFYHLGKSLGIDSIARYSRLLGFGRPTGLDIPGEKGGLVPDPEWSLERRGTPWYPGETISVAIGQGPVLVTPMQMASAMATVANGGFRVTPHLVDSQAAPEPESLPLDPAVLDFVREALWAVVNERGTGARARVAGLDVAGKTGTAQVVAQATRIESEDLPSEQRDHAWFASFAPVDDPRLVVVVFVEHGGKGSASAAPLAKQLYEIYFRDSLELRRPA